MKNFINWQSQFKNYNELQDININKNIYNEQQELYDPYQGFIKGNMFPTLYNQYKISRPYEIQPMNEQAEILTELNSLEFAAHDLNLYLDNYPNDQQIINLSNELNYKLQNIIEKYEKKYGPILVNTINEKNYWQWNKMPWPWEN
jgi:spore coat protein JB